MAKKKNKKNNGTKSVQKPVKAQNSNLDSQVEVAETEEAVQSAPVVASTTKAQKAKGKADSTKSKEASKKKKEKKPSKVVAYAKETTSELKKVTKPSFREVVKRTCVVLAFVIICALLLLGMDQLLQLAYRALITGATGGAA